ncbi:DUF2802 domain-containing protein [Catenovulum sediminis]|uniref:DUF2802 domain-containing protein n=1 Tax=Catenovulum sediminis TaxID=1740262 RepID=A0ABV1RGR6_9ALTE
MFFAVLANALVLWVWLSSKKNQQVLQTNVDEKLSHLERENKILRHEINEVNASSISMGKNIRQLAQYFAELENRFSELELVDPESKLYSRAAKLAEKGASIEEIIEECEIPRAEAELVVSLRKRKR